MYFRQYPMRSYSLGDPPAGAPPDAAEQAQQQEMETACKDIHVLEWLEKDGPGSLREYILQLERRLAATPRLVQGHEQLRKLKAMRLRPQDFAKSLVGLRRAFPEIDEFRFPPGYAVGTVDEELAQVRCKLARARLNFQVWNRTGQRPKDAGSLRLCSPRPGRPLSFWTIGGFRPNDASLTPAQLSEINLMAGGLARNPRVRTGRLVLILTGGFAPGENASIGDKRAIVVQNELTNALKKIDVSLLAVVGFERASEPWCSEVVISMRERNI